MSTVRAIVVREVREALPPFVFFLVLFHLIALTKAVALDEYSVTALRATFATVGALIVAKAILLVEALPILRLRSASRLIELLWKTLLFALVALAFRFLEELLPLVAKYGSVVTAVDRLLDEVHWPLFWVIALWMLLSLFCYCVAAELVRALGVANVRQALFGRGGGRAER
ncbi:MAG: hypothetical protein AMJ64_07565 [Betaproteobacteria bacterium SG8_39]|nr:MAG: hypothetical protein AMJ64_07565 [Betaproteobacteria bacterium SG8_39]